MSSGRTILRHLKNLQNYLDNYPQNRQPAHFEKLISETFAHIFHTPFFCINNEDATKKYRVTWQGNSTNMIKAPEGGADTIAYCHNFYLTIESTLSELASQCNREFSQSIRHCEDFCNDNNIQTRDAFSLLICKSVHRDTFRAIRVHPQNDFRIIPLTVSQIQIILQTSILACTIRHLELRRIFNRISDLIRESSSLDNFNTSADNSIINWQKDVLAYEIGSFLGIKACEAIKNIGRRGVATGEIFERLIKHPIVGQYYNLLGKKIGMGEIEKYLLEKGFACRIGKIQQTNEMMFELVPYSDFNASNLRLVEAVERIL